MATHRSNEYKLTVGEQKFVSYYIETNDMVKAVEMANFKTTSPKAYAKKLLAKGKVQKELKRQLKLLENEAVASADEVMVFLTETMRGNVKDQFGLEATLKDRMDAAKELAKRQIDMQKIADSAEANELKITLSWKDDEDTTSKEG